MKSQHEAGHDELFQQADRAYLQEGKQGNSHLQNDKPTDRMPEPVGKTAQVAAAAREKQPVGQDQADHQFVACQHIHELPQGHDLRHE